MSFKHLHAFIAIMAGCMLASCHSEINLQNIDKKAEIEMGLALPIGSVHATIRDFFGSGVDKFYVDTVGNQGVITWKDTFRIARNFHQVDLAKYISEKELSLNVYDHIPAVVMIGTNKRVIGTGDPYTLDFDMPLKLTGINHPDSLAKERLDSALIEIASFSSIISQNNLPLKWEWIDSVTLDLGEQIHRPARNTMVVYDKYVDNYGYDQTIPTKVDNFTINLMKKNSAGQYIVGQVVDSCNFTIHFTFTIPKDTIVEIPKDAGFNYKLGVQFIDYAAIWGKFIRSKEMYDESVIDLSESWGALDFISKWSVPFAEPKINMSIVTRVAGALKVDGEYLYSVDAFGQKHYASFLRGDQTFPDFPKQFEKGEYLDPTHSIIGDSTINMKINFDKDPTRGHIDQLFQGMPQKLGYKFNLDFTYGGSYPDQIRITPNTAIRIDAECILPFIFNQGLAMKYVDTIRNVNLTQYSIESMIDSVKMIDTVKATDVVLFLKAHNSIPLDVYASMRCLDSLGNIIKDPIDSTKPLMLFPQDTITLKAPNYVKSGGTWNNTPGETVITARLSKKQLDMLPQIKSIHYDARIDDKSLDDAYSKGMSNIRITDDQGITLKIGVTAHVDAIFDLNVEDNKK